MRDRPDGIALLGLARRALLEELLQELPEEHRVTARMVANAMAIAARELAAGDAPTAAYAEALATLYDEGRELTSRGGTAESVEEVIQRLAWWLAAEIRGGRRDGDGAVHDLLRARVIDRVRETNPKLLDEAGTG